MRNCGNIIYIYEWISEIIWQCPNTRRWVKKSICFKFIPYIEINKVSILVKKKNRNFNPFGFYSTLNFDTMTKLTTIDHPWIMSYNIPCIIKYSWLCYQIASIGTSFDILPILVAIFHPDLKLHHFKIHILDHFFTFFWHKRQ